MRAGIDPYFDKIFMVGDHLYWFMPLNAYRLYSRPCSATELAWRKVLYYFIMVSLFVLLFLNSMTFLNAVLVGNFIGGLSITVSLLLAVIAINLTAFTWNASPQLIEVLQLLHDDFPKTQGERQRLDLESLVGDWQRHMGSLVKVYKVSVSGFCVAPVFFSLGKYCLNGIWVNLLPMYLWLPFDPLAWPIYPVVLVFEIWLVCVNCLVVFADSVAFGEYSKVLCMQFNRLARNCRDLQFTGCFTTDFKAIKGIIKAHNSAISVAERIQNLFSVNLLIIYTCSASTFCIILFLALNESSPILALQHFFSFVAYLCYQYVYAYFGDQIIVHVSSRSSLCM